jgi:hypothetical protein
MTFVVLGKKPLMQEYFGALETQNVDRSGL